MIEYILLSDASQCLERLLKKSLILGGIDYLPEKEIPDYDVQMWPCYVSTQSNDSPPPPLCYRNMRLTNHKQNQDVQNNQDKNKYTRSSRMATRSYESYVGAVRQCCARRCQGLTDIII